jgi:aminopeptidase N
LRSTLLLSICVVAASLPLRASSQEPGRPGIDVERYVFRLSLRDDSDEILGRAAVRIRFTREGENSFHLDLVGRAPGSGSTGMSVESVSRGDAPAAFAHEGGRLEIRLDPPSKAGEIREYAVAYRGVPGDGLRIGANCFGERTFFGDNWPEGARHWLPVVDHPRDKASVEFLVEAPERYRVVANGVLAETRALEGNRTLTHWREDSPLPTKVMAFGAARFDVRDAGGKRAVQLWVYPQDREAGFRRFAVAPEILDFCEAMIGPFPYGKLAVVQSTTKYGAMENAGAVFISEKMATWPGLDEEYLAHEIVHQWFGDSVTEVSWADFWLTEGLATYITHMYLASKFGAGTQAGRLRESRDRVIEFARANPTVPVVPADVKDPCVLLTPLSYEKGGWFFHMLRREVGEEAFGKGLRAFYARHLHGNAGTGDLRLAMEQISNVRLEDFFRQWLYRPGHPVLGGTWDFDSGSKTLRVALKQEQAGDPPFRVLLDLGVMAKDGTRRVETVPIAEREHFFEFPCAAEPDAVVLDPDAWLLMEDAGFHRK